MVICLPLFTSFLHFWTCKDLWMLLWKCYTLCHVWFFVIPWTVTRQAPLCPWNSPGKNTGVGGHSLLQGSSWPRDWTRVSCIAGRFFTWAMSAPRTVKIVLKIKDLFWRKDLVCYEKVMLEQYQRYLLSTHPAPPPAVPSQGLPHNSKSRCQCQNHICIVLIIYKMLSHILYCLILMNDWMWIPC